MQKTAQKSPLGIFQLRNHLVFPSSSSPYISCVGISKPKFFDELQPLLVLILRVGENPSQRPTRDSSVVRQGKEAPCFSTANITAPYSENERKNPLLPKSSLAKKVYKQALLSCCPFKLDNPSRQQVQESTSSATRSDWKWRPQPFLSFLLSALLAFKPLSSTTFTESTTTIEGKTAFHHSEEILPLNTTCSNLNLFLMMLDTITTKSQTSKVGWDLHFIKCYRCHHICKINFCYRLAYNKRCTGWIGVRENIHWGYSLDAKEVMNGWKSSSGHNANILTRDVSHFRFILFPDFNNELLYLPLFHF